MQFEQFGLCICMSTLVKTSTKNGFFPYGIIKSKSTITIHVQVCTLWCCVMQFPSYTTVLEEFKILCINNIVQYYHRFKSDTNQKSHLHNCYG